jgi:tetratricopeptide (TPR) repeat protein
MLFPARLSAVLFGTAALVSVVYTLPSHAALSHAQVGEVARQVTVQIDGQAPGSGVIISRQGQTYYVLTAEHVVATADEYEIITPDGKKHPLDYKNVKKLPGLDLAVLTFTSPQSYRVVEMGDSNTLKESAPIFISGFPLLGRDTTQTGYRFIIGNLLAQANRLLAKGYGLAYVNNTFAGMSGGPILNQQGQLVGIHGASKTDLPETQGLNQQGTKVGLNLGIPINSFRRAVPQVVPLLQLPNLPAAALSDQPTAADLLIQAVEQAQASKGQQGLRMINQAIRLQPNYAGAYFVRATFRRSFGDKQGAIKDYTEVIRLNPQFADAFNNRGAARAELGDKQGAIKDFTEVIRINPQLATAYNNRGNSRAELGDKQGAIKDFTEAIRLNPQLATAYNNRGNARLDLGDKQGAVTDYNEAIRLSPQFATAYNNRGNARLDLGDKQGAVTDYNEAIRLNPQYADAFRNRGAARADLGDKQGGIKDFTEAVRLNPQYADAYHNRALTRFQLGDKQGGIKDSTEAIRLDPQFAQAFVARGLARADLGDKQGAILDLQRGAELARAQGNQQVYELATQNLRRLQR